MHEVVGGCKRFPTYTSGGIINSIFESCEDISVNAGLYQKPTLVCLAGKDRIVNNEASRLFFKKCGVKQEDLKIIEFEDSYHNIHKEPDFKLKLFAEVYEFIHERLTIYNPPSFSMQDMTNPKWDRPKKKKSIKVKRSVLSVFLSTYLLYGTFILVIQFYLRRWNQIDLGIKEALATLIFWPQILMQMLYQISKLYYGH
jgi:hypothetical protein